MKQFACLFKGSRMLPISFALPNLESFCFTLSRFQKSIYRWGIRSQPYTVLTPSKFFLGCVFSYVLCFANQVFSQSGAKSINGIISNSSSEPLADVTVSVKGTNSATTSDAQGRYSIKIPNAKSVLVFTNIGFNSYEVTVGTKSEINVSLTSSSASLEDVVVIGYGSVKKKDVTGSVGKVNMEDLQKAPVKSFDDALAGRVAGVQVTSNDGQPGSNAEINIRGVGSVTQSSAPLYVIDGFPQETSNANSINPAEIESIEVLKDASATAIYGARGSNGVIIITTKRGKSAKPTITYDAYYGGQRVIKKMELMSPYEFVRLQNDINPYYANLAYFTNGRTLEYYKDVKAIDWQDMTFNKTPTFQNHYISVSSKQNKTAYTLSGSYTDQMGLIKNSGFKRYQSRFTLDQEINSKLKVGVNANYAYTKAYGVTPSTQTVQIGNQPSSSQFNFMQSLWSYRPVLYSTSVNDEFLENLIDEEAIAGGISDNRINPYIGTMNTVNNTYTTTLTANGYLEYKITKDLKLRSTIGLNIGNGSNEVFNGSNTLAGSPLLSYGKMYGLNAFTSNSKSYSFLNENTLIYIRQFNKNNVLDAVVGFTTQRNNNSNTSMRVINLPNEALGIKGIGQGTPFQVGAGSSLSALQSFLGRVNYTFRQNYLFTASFRADGSSKFHPDNRWGYFPSGAVAWRFGNEQFMKRIKFISDAKLRVSYGATGNNRVSDFAYLSAVSSSSGTFYSFNDVSVPGLTVTSIANKNLKWETSTQFDVGLDISFLRNRINLEVDYYKKKTDNLLLNANQAYSTGFATAFENVGSLSNEGLEFTLNTTNVKTKSFTWTSSFNISFNRNRILSLVGDQEALFPSTRFEANTTPNFIAKIGRPVAQFYGYVADGIYQFDDFYKIPNGTTGYYYVLKENIPYYATKNSLANPNTNGAVVVQPGDLKFKDLNGDGFIDALNDFTTIGSPYPLHFGGVSNNFSYKGFDLSIFLQWNYGNQIINANRIKFEGGTGAPQGGNTVTGANAGYINNNMFATYANRWTPTNPSNIYPRVNANTGGTRAFSTRIIEDGSYLRIKTVSLGYNLPLKWMNKIKITNARIYAAAQNLLTFTKYTGPDPEVSTFSGNNLTPGFDFSPYPRTRVLTLGARISF